MAATTGFSHHPNHSFKIASNFSLRYHVTHELGYSAHYYSKAVGNKSFLLYLIYYNFKNYH